MRIEQIKSNLIKHPEKDLKIKHPEKDLKISTHSHIKGLVLNEDGISNREGNGFIGQNSTRKGAGLEVDLISSQKIAGRVVLFASGTGKTTLTISQESSEKRLHYV